MAAPAIYDETFVGLAKALGFADPALLDRAWRETPVELPLAKRAPANGRLAATMILSEELTAKIRAAAEFKGVEAEAWLAELVDRATRKRERPVHQPGRDLR